jgi:hypothetical protein
VPADEPELHRRGIRHVALFGSVARGVATATSDIFEYVALTDYIGALLPVWTDIADRAMLKPRGRARCDLCLLIVPAKLCSPLERDLVLRLCYGCRS